MGSSIPFLWTSSVHILVHIIGHIISTQPHACTSINALAPAQSRVFVFASVGFCGGLVTLLPTDLHRCCTRRCSCGHMCAQCKCIHKQRQQCDAHDSATFRRASRLDWFFGFFGLLGGGQLALDRGFRLCARRGAQQQTGWVNMGNKENNKCIRKASRHTVIPWGR